jgi:predicted acyl esterase
MKLLTILILTNWVLFAQFFPKGTQQLKRYDFNIVTADNVSLDCTKFIPTTPKPKNGWPVMLYCHGYGDSKESELPTAKDQAQFGYITFAYSMRGQGHSGGLSNLISTVEMNDLLKVVDYIKKDSLADSTKILILGASQGGIIPFMAACNGLKVLTVISDLASPDFASSWIENGSVKMTFFWSVDYDTSIIRYDDKVIQLRNWALSKKKSAWDSLAVNLPRERDFPDKVPQCKTPILITNAWQDRFFNASGMIQAASMLKTPYMIYIGAVDGHGADTSKGENSFTSSWDNNWMQYWLNSARTAFPDTGIYQYASSHFPKINNLWSFSHFSSGVWPPVNYLPLKLYFHPGGALSKEPDNSGIDTSGFRNYIVDSNFTMRQAINVSFKGDLFNSAFKKDILVFETEPLKTDLHFTGIPKLNLFYSSSSDVCQFNAQIWEVTPKGTAAFVTRINYTDRHYKSGQIRNREINGAAYSHIFRKGDRIKVIFTNLDTQPEDSFLFSNPYVLPVLKNGYNTIYSGPNTRSYIELPVQKE